MRVHVVDPSSYTPPYDHALCRALGQAGARVDLFTSRFPYGATPPPDSYLRHDFFYRRAHASLVAGRRSRGALAAKLVEHLPDMLRYRRAARAADVVHFQWLTVQPLDLHLLPRGRPLLLTAHDILPREPRPGQLGAQRRLYERMDAIVVHSAHGKRRLVDRLGVDPERVQVIPHGVLKPGEGLVEQPLPQELHDSGEPVVLFFGLLRPYKGLELLLEAWRGVQAAQLWIVGMPRMDISRLRADAPVNVRFLPRFIDDAQIPALMRRASLVVLPYSDIDQSGVLFTALGYAKPLLLSDVGGFPEIAASGAARVFKAGSAQELHAGLVELVARPGELARMAGCAEQAGDGEYSWRQIAARTFELYEQLLDAGG